MRQLSCLLRYLGVAQNAQQYLASASKEAHLVEQPMVKQMFLGIPKNRNLFSVDKSVPCTPAFLL